MELIDKNSVLPIALASAGATIAAGYTKLAPASFIATYLLTNLATTRKIGERVVYANPLKNGSFANFERQAGGLRWTAINALKHLQEGDFYVNNFRADYVIKNRVSFSFLLSDFEKKPLKLRWDDLKKGSLILGSMGQGKTEFLLNIIMQYIATNRKLIIHDTKGEFISFFYRENRDYILNFLDERGAFWDIFADIENGLSISLVLDFFNAYFYAVAGDKGDKFWSASAAERFKEIFNYVLLQKNLDNAEKLELLNIKMQEYLAQADASDNKTEQSIAATLKINLNVFFRNAFFAKNKHKAFTITSFFNSKDTRLFLHTIEAAKEENLPFFTAFLSLLFKYQLSFFNKAGKQNYILYILDEYLDFFTKFKHDLRLSLHTKARSYGALLLPAMQFLPKDEKLRQLLISSVENLFVFAVTDIETTNSIKNLFGKVTILRTKKQSKRAAEIEQIMQDFLDDNVLKKLKVGQHITYYPKRNILYLSYTKKVFVEKIEEEYIQICKEKEEEYIKFLDKIKEQAQENISAEFGDLFD